MRRIIRDKHFAFVSAQGSDYFFHESACDEFDALTEGDAVTFVPTTGAKGPRAEAVRRE